MTRADAGEADVTRDAVWRSSNESVVQVSPGVLVTPTGNGRAEVLVEWQSSAARISVEVRDFEKTPPLNFANDIVPIFTKLGCNTGGCHGKASGQNGFKLSLLGFEPEFDYDALVKQARGRRVFPADPDRSLLLAKASAHLPHGGGRRLDPNGAEYQLLRRWMDAGMPSGEESDPKVVRISVWPHERTMAPGQRQQMIVTAHYSDGRQVDVTHLAEYQPNDTEAAVADAHGVVETLGVTGETAIMGRYQGHVAVFRTVVPVAEGLAQAWDFPPNNLVDVHTAAKWRTLGLVPSEPASDGEFIRRASLDICGTLPTAEEVRAFAADSGPAKRAKLIDALVDRNEYADYFAHMWADILHNRRQNVELYRYGTYRFHAWIRQQLRQNRPYDEFVRDIIGAQGDVSVHPPAVFHRLVRSADEYVDNTAQVFLGLRLSCAQCHHHPFEKWSQDDYRGMAAFFARVGRKKEEKVFDFPPRSEWLYASREAMRGRRRARNAPPAEAVQPKPLDGAPMDIAPDDDPRHKLVDWMSRPDNPFFARALVNRYWKHFFGVGLVDPEDDMRVTNPPSNAELLDALAEGFVQSGFDLKQLVRTICQSRTYQLSSVPNAHNEADRRNYSRYYPKRLQAEVLLDAISQVTGVPTQFGPGTGSRAYGRLNAGAFPLGTRAIQLPDESVPSYFLDVYGRPPRATGCQCERSNQPSLTQILTLLNSEEIQQKVLHSEGRAAKLAADSRPDAEKIDDLFLCAHARPPTAEERQWLLDYLASRQDQRPAAYANILWSLINTEQFQLNY
ncbi:MAG: DUF1553 domain-containing protein [Planctomycetes bacterium]|nr:DUF1553 domain-containing protein [Planctomycetota bacterium]